MTERPCPQCGASQPPGAAGVCPACALRGVLREEVPAHGRAVGRYQLIELLGEGGMGAVWLAEDPALDRLVAVKMLPLASFRRKAMEARLRREARAVASLNHPHVVKVFEVGEDRETLYLAMEYVEGGDLRDGLREGRWEPRRAARFLLQAADAVAHAHAAGVLHRDLKPGNVLLTETGQPRLADFGLAAPVGARGDLTLTGQALGTPAYMAPEVAEGRPVDVRVDVYGLGAILYELLTGRAPFTGSTTAAILTAVSREQPVRPRTVRPAI
ncbi:MAG: serine/threonine-protein kinase, partial [Verrucomicrobiota bacterium]